MGIDSFIVAAIQARPNDYLLNPENVPHAIDLLKSASRQGAQFACFPEAYPGTGEEVVCSAARKFKIFTIAGFLVRDLDKFYNVSTVINSEGQVIGRQIKIHPAPGVEPFLRGDKYEIVETPYGKVGVLICIDGWGFPEGFYRLNKAGADIIFNPCLMFKKKPQKKMSLLSRALDYKLPIIAPNNAYWSLKIFREDQGLPPEGGGSLIISPPSFRTPEDINKFMREAVSCEHWIAAEGSKEEEILFSRIDIKAIRQMRSLWDQCFGACLF
jgi:predicted amidohydrolase